MQGYDYIGFIEWNQKNRKIIEAEGKISKNVILQQKFIRDRTFLSVLIETTKCPSVPPDSLNCFRY